MQTPLDRSALLRRFKTVGTALMRVDLNNSHSGNMSLRDPCDPQRFFITASGSMCGALGRENLVPVHFSDLGWSGAQRPSSETNTHRRVLELPGANACVHCHAKAATVLSLETPDHLRLLQRFKDRTGEELGLRFQPVDFFGAALLGAIGVRAYPRAVGSVEMEESIPRYLRHSPLAIVAGHGPFARGGSLEECLHYLSLLENSARLALALRRRGVDPGALQRLILENRWEAFFPERPRVPDFQAAAAAHGGEPASTGPFADWLAYNFDQGLSAYAVGSLSCRASSLAMIFSMTAAAPKGIATACLGLPLAETDPQAADVRLHRRIYAHTPFKACVIAPAPLATAEATAVWSAAWGGRLPEALSTTLHGPASELPVILPIDAEAAYYKIRIPVAPPGVLHEAAPPGLLPDMLTQGGGCAAIAGVGVIAAGETLDQAVYRLSLMERIAHFRQEVDLNHRLFGSAPVNAFPQA